MIKNNQKFFNGLLVVIDVLVFIAAFFVAWFLRFESNIVAEAEHLSFVEHSVVLIISLPILIIVQYLYDLYAPQRMRMLYKEILGIIKSNLTLVIILIGILFLIKEVHISRLFIAFLIVANTIFTIVERSIVRIVLRVMRSKGYNIKYVLVIGAGILGKRYLKSIFKNKQLGYIALGILDDNEKLQGKNFIKVPVIGKISNLQSVIEQKPIDEVIVALPLHLYGNLERIINICEKAGVKMLIIPDYLRYLPAKPHFDEIDDIPLINTRYVPLDNIGNKIIKRIVDLFVAFIALIVFSPLMIVIASIIKSTSKGPVFFKQERIGYNKKPFVMYKFRTMKCQAGVETNNNWTTKDDCRKTSTGEFLRRTSIDELPQLLNVIKGDMSIIGPRPERSYFVEQFREKIPKYMIKHYVRPGMTGWAQVNGWRGDTSIKERIKHDIYYIENWSLVFDLRILFLTVFKGFINKNAY